MEELDKDVGFETLWVKLRTAFFNILNGQLKFRIKTVDTQLAKVQQMLTGRQIVWFIAKEFQIDSHRWT